MAFAGFREYHTEAVVQQAETYCALKVTRYVEKGIAELEMETLG